MTAQNFDEIVSFGKDNVEALVKSGTVAVKGLEELTKVYSSLASHSIEQTSSAVKALTTAKNPAEFQAIYSGLAKSNFEAFISEGRKIQELTGTIVTSSLAPLGARVQAITGAFKAS